MGLELVQFEEDVPIANLNQIARDAHVGRF